MKITKSLLGLYAFVISLAIPPFSMAILGRTPTVFVSDIIIGLSVFFILTKRRILDKYILAAAGLFAVFVVLSYFRGIDSVRSLSFVKIYLLPFGALFLGIISFRSKEDIDRVFVGLLMVISAWALESLLNWNAFESGVAVLASDLGAKDMLQTSWGRSNAVAAVNLLLVPFIFYRLIFAHFLEKVLMLGILLLLLVSSGLSMSRGATTAFIVGVIFWFYHTFKLYGLKRAYVWIFAGGVLAVVLAFSLWVIPAPFTDLFISKWQSLYLNTDILTTDARMVRWQAIISYLLAQPFGAGLGNYIFALGELNPLYGGSAHNLLLDVMMDTGLLAGGIYVAMLTYLAWRARESFKYAFTTQDKMLVITQATIALIFVANSMVEPNYFSPIYMALVSLNFAGIIVMNRRLREASHARK